MTINLSHSIDSASSLVDILLYRAKHQPDQKAYTFLKNGEQEADSLTYEQLHLKSRAIASALQALNLVGQRALLLYQPGLDFIAAFFGCLYAGVVAVPAYPPRKNQNLNRLQAITADAEAQIVLTTTTLVNNRELFAEQGLELAKLQWLTTDALDSELTRSWQQVQLEENSLAFLQYTSGSTGNPKGVMVSHNNLLHNSHLIAQSFGHSSNSKGLIWLPPYHDMGLIGGILQPLYVGFPVVLMSPVDFLQKPMRWLQAISRYQATTSGGPNFAYELCLRKVTPEHLESLDLSSWDVAFTGAEPIRAHTLEEFAKTFAACGFRQKAFYPCYGMAETTLIVSGGAKTQLPIVCKVDPAALEQNRVVKVTNEQIDARTLIGCGQSCEDMKIVIVNPESLSVCSEKEVGEIWISGPSVAQGYWNQAELTEKSFYAYLADTEISDREASGPFLRTGDLGFLQNNELFVTGRIKDIIIIRGQNHYPQDIELTVEKSHPALRIGCLAAFAVEFKGSERLVVVAEVERTYLKKLNVQEVVNKVRQAVITEHGLDVFAVVLVKTGSIPKTSSGKIRRYACRAAFLSGSLDIVQDWSESPESTKKYMNLQAEIETILQKLQVEKQG
ncbi:MAG: fatty acyl-AMP ligase [Nostoc sp. ChiSLP02]|nr:fatty acyl-AMP ligase [Nostoc sp. DedSLP05]MDZ8102849.1 fatty acyl-AMP ligase [Nostoc sp. DedSLP01]MDZ8184140.1 fatty acyl-AMP ligase [Nostoc sp. ChiSLP02]